MTGALAVVIVIAAIVALRFGLSLISALTDKGVDVAGRAIGNALKPGTPQSYPRPQGELTVTMPAEDIRRRLVSLGVLDPGTGCLTTSSGVVVEITVASGTALACRWQAAVAEKPTQIMGDLLRSVRQVDARAQVVL
jgi:hypothetical protein